MQKESKKRDTIKINFAQRGQVLLIVILVIIVSLTIGLSLVSRGITNLKTSTEEADSQKALAAVEAEIEKRLQNTAEGTFNGTFSSASYRTTVAAEGGNTFLLNGGSLIIQGEGADVWLADHNADGSINYSTVRSPQFFHLYWGASGEEACNSSNSSGWPAAIEVMVVSGTSATNVTTTRYAYDRCSRGNNFSSANLSNSTNSVLADFKLRTPQGANSINITNGVFVRVVPVYKSTIVGVSACNHGGGNCTNLSSQGFQISSTGTAGSANRKISVFKGHQQAFLPYLSYGLFVPAL